MSQINEIDIHELAKDAMQGLLAGIEPSLAFAAKVVNVKPEAYTAELHWPKYVAKMSYAMAKAMKAESIKK